MNAREAVKERRLITEYRLQCMQQVVNCFHFTHDNHALMR